jgi:hypothetical protein
MIRSRVSLSQGIVLIGESYVAKRLPLTAAGDTSANAWRAGWQLSRGTAREAIRSAAPDLQFARNSLRLL